MSTRRERFLDLYIEQVNLIASGLGLHGVFRRHCTSLSNPLYAEKSPVA